MLRNIKHYLENREEGLDFFSLFPLVLFTIILLLVIYYVFFVMSDKTVDEEKNLPFNDQNNIDYGKKE